jgi:hypothetical protein
VSERRLKQYVTDVGVQLQTPLQTGNFNRMAPNKRALQALGELDASQRAPKRATKKKNTDVGKENEQEHIAVDESQDGSSPVVEIPAGKLTEYVLPWKFDLTCIQKSCRRNSRKRISRLGLIFM